jgi:thiol-disulfide isomerase/thioredoxin
LPLPNGSVAPDFTLTDVYGNTHNLYTYLDQGKTVVLDFFAVWCGPCWNYHQTHILENYYNLYGPGGTNEVMVLAVEADFSTPASAIFGGPGSIGNWTAGTSYPIMDDGTGQVAASYQISYFPTLYVVCPNKKVYEVGQAPLSGWENWKQSCSLSETTASNDILCFGETTGSIDLTATGGLGSLSFQWNSGATTEDLNNLAAGTYYCTITEGQGHTVEAGPIQISSPPPLTGQTQSAFGISCFGDSDGIAAISATGGVPGYQFVWDNGTTGPIATGLSGGVHHATITDANGCTEVHSVLIHSPAPINVQTQSTPDNCGQQDGTLLLATTGGTFPYQYDIGSGSTGIPFFQNLAAGAYVASITDAAGCEEIVNVVVEAEAAPVSNAGADQVIDCNQGSVVLDGTASSAGPSYSYIWTASDGTILNSSNEIVIEVDASDTYQLEVIDNSNGCNSFSTVVVTEDLAVPVSDAGPDMLLNCLNGEVVPDAGGSSQGPVYAYNWTTSDGLILGSADVLDPVFAGPGTYDLTVTSTQNGCSSTSTVAVTADVAIPEADAGPAQQLDCSSALAFLDASSSNTSPDLVVSWSTPDGNIVNGANDWIAEVDAPGEYTLTVLDTGNGCENTDQVTVIQDLDVPEADAGSSMELNCLDTTVDLDGTNSETGPNIGYLWTTADGQIDSGATSMTPTVSAPGTYELEVIDNANGCTNTSTVMVTELPPVEAGIDTVTDALCAADASGTATVSGSGGASSYTYNWSNGATGATADGLPAGTYEVTVSDQIGCSDIVTVVVGEPDVIVVNATSTDETSNDANDGTASANPGGGVGGYQYLWSTGETSSSISGLAPGLYTVDITDSNGCTVSQSVTVNSFSCQLTAESDAVATSCFGGNDGAAAIILDNEEGPASFDWSTGDTSPEVTDLEAGIYTVTVQDANNCQLVVEVEVTQPLPVGLEVVGSEAVDCAENASGMAELEASGGVGGYTYEWPDGSVGPVQDQLAAGIYTVTATDANGCSALLDVLITEPDPLTADIDVLHESSNGAADGMASVHPEGGVADYTYNWSTGDTGPSVEGLAPVGMRLR